MRLGRLVPVVVVLFVVAVTLPSGAAAASTEGLVYKANKGSGSKTLMKNGEFKLVGKCENSGAIVTLVPTHGKLGAIGTGHEDGGAYFHKSDQITKNGPYEVGEGRDDATGKVIVYPPAISGRIYRIDNAEAKSGFKKDCVWAGLVQGNPDITSATVVLNGDSGRLAGTDKRAGATLVPSLDCSANTPELTADSGAPENVTGSNWTGSADAYHFYDPLPEASQSTLGGPEPVFLATTILGSSQGPTVLTAGSRDIDTGCEARATYEQLAPSSKRAITYFATAPDPGLATILALGGLKLSASCNPGDLSVYASTDHRNALLHTSVVGPGGALAAADDDFDNPNSHPQFLLDFGGINRVGYMIYVSPSGRVVSLDWVGANSGNDCAFSGIATSGR